MAGYYQPKWSVYSGSDAPKPAHHSLFGNLLRDVVEIPKGIIPGMVALAKHPIREAKLIGEDTGHFYSPLVHGQWGKFWGNVHAHPLQPLLDAVSVATLAFGGVGAGIKAADATVSAGRLAEVTAAMDAASTNKTVMAMGRSGAEWMERYNKVKSGVAGGSDSIARQMLREEVSPMPSLTKAAGHFRKGTAATTKTLATDVEGYNVYKSYSANLFTRALQKHVWEKGFTGLSKIPHSPLGKGGIYDYTEGGRATRSLQLRESQRLAATGETKRMQVKLLGNVHKKLLKEHHAGKISAAVVSEEFSKAVSRLVEASDTVIGINGERVPVHLASELPTTNNPFRYEKDMSKVSAPTGPVTYRPATEAGPAKTEIHLPSGETKTVKGASAAKMGKGKGAIHLPDKAFQTVQKETSGRPFIKIPEEDLMKTGKGLKQVYRDFTDKLGARYEGTTIPSEAKIYTDPKTGERYYNMIRKDSINKLREGTTAEGERVAKTMSLIAKKPIVAWKYAVLSLSPRYFVNNLTNYLMYAMSANPVATTRGILDSIRYTKGVKAAAKAEADMGNFLESEIIKYTGGENGWYHQHFAGIHASDYGTGIASGHFQKVAGVGFKVVEDVIYAPGMKAGTMTAMRSIPAVRELERMYRDQGMSKVEAFNAAAMQMSADPAVHQMVMRMVGDWAGQYYHLNGLEKMIMAVVPFYNWDRHAIRFAKTLVVEHPTTSSLLAATGQRGEDWADQQLGKLPSFMEGAVPIGRLPGLAGKIEDVVLGVQQPGRKKILLTHSINPLAAAAENIHALAALGGAYQGREAIGSQANPLISGLFEGITGESVVTGAKVKYSFLGIGGPIGAAAHNIFATPAPVKLLAPALHAAGGTVGLGKGGWGTPQPKVNKRTGQTKPFLYSKSESQNLRSWVGLNIRDFNQQAAQSIYNEQHGIKSPPKDTKSFLNSIIGQHDFGKVQGTKGTTGYKVYRKRTRKASKPSARTSAKFPPLRSSGKKGLKGIGGIGGI